MGLKHLPERPRPRCGGECRLVTVEERGRLGTTVAAEVEFRAIPRDWRALGKKSGLINPMAARRSATKPRRSLVTPWTRFGIVLGWSPPRKFPPEGGGGTQPMLAHVRVGFVAALVTLASFAFSSIPATAAGKAFQRGDLDGAAIKLEAEVKKDAGRGSKPL